MVAWQRTAALRSRASQPTTVTAGFDRLRLGFGCSDERCVIPCLLRDNHESGLESQYHNSEIFDHCQKLTSDEMSWSNGDNFSETQTKFDFIYKIIYNEIS